MHVLSRISVTRAIPWNYTSYQVLHVLKTASFILTRSIVCKSPHRLACLERVSFAQRRYQHLLHSSESSLPEVLLHHSPMVFEVQHLGSHKDVLSSTSSLRSLHTRLEKLPRLPVAKDLLNAIRWENGESCQAVGHCRRRICCHPCRCRYR